LSGIYQVLTVDNTFSHGKFEQDIECIRLPDQPQDYAVASSTESDIRPAMPEKPETPQSKPVAYTAYGSVYSNDMAGGGEDQTAKNTDGEDSGPDNNTQVSQSSEEDLTAGEASGDNASALSSVAQSDSVEAVNSDTFDTSFA